MTKFFDEIWKHGWRSVDECSILYKQQEFFPIRVKLHLLFSFLLQKALKSVFVPRYQSLKLNHDTNYLMTSEATVEDLLMSAQFYINSKSFFISFYSSSTVFIFIAKTLESVYLPRYEPLKLHHDTNYLMKSEDTVEDPLMSFQFYINSKSVFISCYSPSTVFIFIKRDDWIFFSTTLWIFKTKPWHKVFNDIWRHGCRSVDGCSI